MDPLFFGGLVVALLSIVVAMVMDGNSMGVLIGPSSIVIVVVGSLGTSLMAYRLGDVSRVPKALIKALNGKPPEADGTVTLLADLADVARRDGVLALESRLEEIDDAYLRGGLQLIVDGLDADQVREMLEIDNAALDERHQLGIGFFKQLGGYAPTFGMLGTVIGLINMLTNLSDPQQLGAGMSVALLTTLYGVAFANLFFLPVAARLERMHEQELAVREVVLEGVLAVQAGASPRLLVERLETYLPPERRIGLKARVEGGADAAAPVDAKAA